MTSLSKGVVSMRRQNWKPHNKISKWKFKVTAIALSIAVRCEKHFESSLDFVYALLNELFGMFKPSQELVLRQVVDISEKCDEHYTELRGNLLRHGWKASSLHGHIYYELNGFRLFISTSTLFWAYLVTVDRIPQSMFHICSEDQLMVTLRRQGLWNENQEEAA